jgi:hypothetical protein
MPTIYLWNGINVYFPTYLNRIKTPLEALDMTLKIDKGAN